MARKKSKHPTEHELEILKILWDSSPLLVREVRERLETAGRKLAHTSLITTLNVMVDKGYASREGAGRGYQFSPAVSESEISRGMVGDIVDRVFNGSAHALMLNLLGNQKLSDAERVELQTLINKTTESD